MSNKIILLINLSGSAIGGAQRRYISLFNYLNKTREDYHLVLNKGLYQTCISKGLLSSNNNIVLLDIKYDHISQDNVHKINEEKNLYKKIKISKFYRFLGKNKTFFKNFISWVYFIRSFIKIYRKIHPTIVYAIWTGGIFVWLLKYIIRFKLIYSYNDSSLYSVSKKYYNFFSSEYWVLKFADKVDFLSKGIVIAYEKKFKKIDPKRILITPNSFIDYSLFYPTEKDNWVIFLGRLDPLKNPILYLQAICYYCDHYQSSEVSFFIIGEGHLEKDINIFINKYNLRNVIFIGSCYEPWKYLRKSRIFVSLQQNNNYPSQALMEAMACENAIIASDVGETQYLVSEDEGLLVKFNPIEIAEAMHRLLSDIKKTDILGKNARKKVIKTHTIDNFASYFYSITDS